MTWAAALLCAGLGTRLRPLTAVLPKPLVPVGDRPLVDHAVTLLQAAGARELSFNAFFLAEQVQRYVATLARPQTNVRCVVEHELLGTAGGVRGLYQGHDHVLVWNGDIYAPDLDVAAVLSFGRQEWPVLVVANPSGHAGVIGLDRTGGVCRLRGREFGVQVSAADYVGIAVLPRAFIDTLPRRGCLVGDGLLPWLAQGKRVATIAHRGHWSDGGTLRQYLAQNQDWLARQRLVAEPAPPEATAFPGSYLGTGARCAAGVELAQSVIGQGGHVLGRGTLSCCVVWPGAVATAPLSDAVSFSGGTIAAGDIGPGGRG